MYRQGLSDHYMVLTGNELNND